MTNPFLKLTELSFKGDDLKRTPMLVNLDTISQIFERPIEKTGPVIIGQEHVAQATIIKLKSGMGFHVEERAEAIYDMVSRMDERIEITTGNDQQSKAHVYVPPRRSLTGNDQQPGKQLV
jgi:hypothetical protein